MNAAAKSSVAATQGGNTDAEPMKMQKRIGSTLYLVNIHFSGTGKETMDEIILRLIRNEAQSEAVGL